MPHLHRHLIDKFFHRYDKYYHSRHKHGLKHLVADVSGVMIILTLVIFIGYVFLAYNQGALGQLVRLDVKADPLFLVSGEDVTLKISYYNESQQKVRSAKVFYEMPAGFTVKTISPKTASSTAKPAATPAQPFEIGDLDPGAHGEVSVTGLLVGQVGGQFRPLVRMEFEPTQFYLLSTGQVIARPSFDIADSSLAVKFNAPREVSDHQPFPLTIKYQNTSFNNALPAVYFEPVWDSQFKSPTPEVNLSVASLAPRQSGELLLSGVIDGHNQPDARLEVKAHVKVGSANLYQSQASVSVSILYPKLKVDVAPSVAILDFGHAVTYKVTARNDEAFEIRGLQLSVELNNELFSSPAPKLTDSGKTPLKPGQSKDYEFTATVRSSLGLNFKKSRDQVTVTAKYKTPSSNTTNPAPLEVSAVSNSPLNSDLRLNLAAHYFTADGDQLGRGPLPPRVNKETKYWVFINVYNTLNPVRDTLVLLTLPANVVWTGKSTVSAGLSLQIDPETGGLFWKVGDLKAGGSPLTAGLEVSLRPTPNLVGTEPLLIQRATVSGTDTTTGKDLSNSASTVTTRLTDQEATGLSQVGE
ncbi:hypothetical protein HY224_03255 [Candidatus Uhrbacteria bacterium]|nr:hypothetical protein [Candidatus Uhrbacteria bacterium]